MASPLTTYHRTTTAFSYMGGEWWVGGGWWVVGVPMIIVTRDFIEIALLLIAIGYCL